MPRRGRIGELTEADKAALAAGTVSMAELAERFGVSRAAMSLHCKRNGITHDLRPGAGVRARREEGARLLARLTAVQDQAERDKLLTGFRDGILLNLFDQASRIAADGGLGPKALRDVAAAAAELETRLIALGLLPNESEADKLPVLRIEVMSQTEAAGIQAQAEAETAMLYGDARYTDAEVDDQQSPAALEVINAAMPGQGAAEIIDLETTRQRLAAIQARQGNAGLRALALRLGIDGVPRSNPERVAALILDRLREQPGLAEKIAA